MPPEKSHSLKSKSWQPSSQRAKNQKDAGQKDTGRTAFKPQAGRKSESGGGSLKPGSMIDNVMRATDNTAATAGQEIVQAKLELGEPGDKYEVEADRTAKEVVHRINSPGDAAISEGEDATVQRTTETIQASDAKGGTLDAGFERHLNSAKSGGQNLDGATQDKMGKAMGADFSGVKVHTDGGADSLNRAVQARAFTTGQHIFFKQGEYNPGSRGGQELLAHELTHVVQQNGAAVQRTSEDRELLQAKEARIYRATDTTISAGQVSRLTIQRADLGLGFTDLKNYTYKSSDFLGKVPEVGQNMDAFRKATKSLGVGGFDTTGQTSNQRVGGGVQTGFADTFRAAVVAAKRIKSNLAGFTKAQTKWAYEHKPVLTSSEAKQLKAIIPSKDPKGIKEQVWVEEPPKSGLYVMQIFDSGKLIKRDPEVDSGRAEFWSKMGEVGLWTPDVAAISVWELSNILHSKELFAKTEFFYFNKIAKDLQKMDKTTLANNYDIKLADESELMTTEQLGLEWTGDSDADKKSCFITTACVQAKGLPDDCHELTVLRAFRDEYMRSREGGEAAIAEYYRIAPQIVDRIASRPDGQEIFASLYEQISASVQAIEADRNEEAMNNYIAVVLQLKEQYL